jgi:hypothetical protein
MRTSICTASDKEKNEPFRHNCGTAHLFNPNLKFLIPNY